jgi:uncharacterized protein DUF3303
MLFMIVERFKNGDPVPVYRRFRDRGRMAPDDVVYIGSWVTPDLSQCFQIMDAPDRARLDEWIANWTEVAEFEVTPVITSAEAQAVVAPRL